ncbi:MAG: hypothetical protein ABIS68_00090, partial [Casimicrobiaceae bacterium]
TIKLKLSNTTPGEAMSRGTIVAVLKYHSDDCYVDDLSGVPESAAQADACRSPNGNITVSDPVGLPGGLGTDPTPFSFNFPSKLPINSTDVLLQVVYRGALGNEADAVAVIAKDLSEPTYFAFHNATDYIHIAAKVYTRSEVNSASNEIGPLLSQVAPQSCVNYLLNPPQLQSDCLVPTPIKLTLGTGTKPLQASVTSLPPQRFVRIAYLAEGATTVFNQLAFTCIPANPIEVTNLRWQLTADPYSGDQTLHYPVYTQIRGIKGWTQFECVLNGDGSEPGNPDNRRSAMGSVAERYPYPIAISAP